ncbi:MAG: prepilin peptidase [Ruminococcaceae bacterium]|nr:prepilin peptidase [Oscillospiraceae bacterium]
MADVFWTVYRTVVAGFFGLLIGSFLNVCIYRLPRGETIVRGHSYCPRCQHPLGGMDLIPVISYLLLRRRCRYCRQPIAARYAKVEVVSGTGFALLVWLWGDGPLSPANRSDACLYGIPDTALNIFMITMYLIAFSGFLVWAMILFDRQTPPRALYLFLLLSPVTKLLWQPQQWYLPFLTAGLASLLCWLLLLRLEQPPSCRLQVIHFTTGFSLLGASVSLPAFLPALAVGALLYLLFKKEKKDRSGPYTSKTAPIVVLIAFLAMLFL